MDISPIKFIFQERRTLSGVSTVTEVCVTGSMRTTLSLSMRAGSRTARSSKTSKVTCNVFTPVCDSVHREGSASGRVGVSSVSGPVRYLGRHPPGYERAVRILLECILVIFGIKTRTISWRQRAQTDKFIWFVLQEVSSVVMTTRVWCLQLQQLLQRCLSMSVSEDSKEKYPGAKTFHQVAWLHRSRLA